jgi:RNA polymerase sigma-70 factor (ECF subfamily)
MLCVATQERDNYLAVETPGPHPVSPAEVRRNATKMADGSGGTDGPLLARLRAGDRAAFEQIVRQHTGRMLAVARRFVGGNDADALDAVQDAFISAFKALPAFSGSSSLGTWLHSIVVRASLMKLRSRRRHPEAQIEDLLPRFLPDGHRANPGAAWCGRTDDLAQLQETRELVRRCIDRLPEAYRTVLLLRDIEEYDTEATAELLGTNCNVVKTRLHRARQALRTLLDPYFGNPVRGGTAQ